MSAFGPITAIDPTSAQSGRMPSLRKQHDALAGDRARKLAVGSRVAAPRGARRSTYGSLEQAQVELRAQHPAHRLVERLLRRRVPAASASRAARRSSRCAGSSTSRPASSASAAALSRRRRGGGSRRAAGWRSSRRRRAVEPPLVPQRRGEQIAIGGAENAVDLVVGVHHRASAGDANRGLERVQVHLAQLARGGMPAGAQFIPPSDAP